MLLVFNGCLEGIGWLELGVIRIIVDDGGTELSDCICSIIDEESVGGGLIDCV
jgi:hypothetical protein